MKNGMVLTFFIGLSLSSPLELRSEFYKYTDEEGNVYFVDDKSKIPLRYREQIKVYKEKYDHLSETERAIQLERDQKEQEERRKELERIQEEAHKLNAELERQIQEEREERRRASELQHREKERKRNLDTGATMTMIHETIADRLKLKASKKLKFQVAGGDLIDTGIGKLSFVQAGPVKRENLQVSIIKYEGPYSPFKGLLGMNFLRGLDYRIDFENNTIIWNP
jgi:predicted aspartyl protease